MTIQDIKSFCKANNTPLTAVTCKPFYDERKGRVTKGDLSSHTGWKAKCKYDSSKANKNPYDNNNPTMMLIDLKPLKLYCFDIDVRNGRTYKDVLEPGMLKKLMESSKYIVETGSKGAHFYFRLNDDFVGITKNYLKFTKDMFKEEEKNNADIDIIMDSVITEGSMYTFDNVNFNYNLIKGKYLSDCDINSGFQVLYNTYLKKDVVEKQNQSKYQYITVDEITEHINNIPNDSINVPDYDTWYRVGQLIYNLLGSSGFDLFNDWSNTNPEGETGYTYGKWRGLRSRDGVTLGVGTLKYLSKNGNESGYNDIIKRYSKNDFIELIVKGDSHEVAKYFRMIKPHSYITRIDGGWYVLQSNNTWSFSVKKPSTLINDIADTFKTIVDENLLLAYNEEESDNRTKKIKILNKFRTQVGTKACGESIGDYLHSMYADEKILEKMDENRHLFAFLDKVVDLDKDTVNDIEPEDYISITTGYKYPTVEKPNIVNDIKLFLFSLFENEEMVKFEIDKLSYALHGTKKHEFFVIETGDGRNGKGTKGVIIKKSFGGYHKSIPISLLTQKSDKKDAASPALVGCKGMRYVEAQEPEANDKIQTGLIKEMTGGDTLTCRGLYGHLNFFVLQALLTIQANGPPKYNKYDSAISMRNIIQPFPFIFVSPDVKALKHNERFGDANIKKKVATDDWRDQFILMLLNNYKIIKNDETFHIPDAVKVRTQENADDNIPIKTWFDKTFIAGTDEIKNTTIYEMYKNSCSHPCNVKDFCSYMRLLNIEQKIKHKVIYWCGIVEKVEESDIVV